jgi:ATP-dependent RNA helicase DeaD
MAKVKRGDVRFMVATDIAARGIDISDLSHVINYSLPEDPAGYLHRVGRTGRIGKKGTALSLVSGAEMMTLKALQTKFGIGFEEKRLPTPEEARRVWTDRHIAELRDAMSTTVFEAFIPLSQQLRARPDGDALMAFALKYFFTHHRMERVQDLQKAEHKREEHERRELGARRPERGGRKARKEEARAGVEEAPKGGEATATGGGETRKRGEEGRRGGRQARARTDRHGAAPEAQAAVATGAATETATDTAAAPEGAPTPGASADKRPPKGRVFVKLGQKDGADEAKLRAFVAAHAPGAEVLAIDVRPSHSIVEVAPEAVEGVVTALHGKELDGKPITAEKARRRRR